MATQRDRRQKPPAAPESVAARSAAESGLDFFEIMRRVTELLASSGDSRSLQELANAVRELVQTLPAQIESRGPLTPRTRRDCEALLKLADSLAQTDLSTLPNVPFEQRASVHPILEVLMRDNFQHLDKLFGRNVAERAFADVLSSMAPPRKRGRPLQIPMDKVQKARLLRDNGLSYAQVARQVDLTPTQVRSLLVHHYSKG